MPLKTGKKHNPEKNRSQCQRPSAARGDAPTSSTNQAAKKRPRLKKQMSRRHTPPKPPKNGYLIWGRHAVFAALKNNDRRVAQIYTASSDIESDIQSHLSKLTSPRRNDLPPIKRMERHRLDAIADPHDKAVHQGMAAAVWPIEPPHLDDFLALYQTGPLRLLLLDHVSDPRNVGAIMRSARAFGVPAVITTFRHAAIENGALARAASGALDHLYYLRVTNLARAIEQLQYYHITVAGLTRDSNMPVSKLSGIDRLAVVLGAEGSGLRRINRDHCDHLVSIDIEQESDSLNVSNAAAIALYAASTSPDE
jgi:23S rRNA (guanosine2251-2'-O)-methyltransferase